MEWYLEALKNYAVFGERARRKEYWMYVLFNLLAVFVFFLVDNFMGLATEDGLGLFSTLYILATFIPSLAVAIRRLHDTGRSGWWYLLSFVPLGGLIFLYFTVQDSEYGQNRWGPNPKTLEFVPA